MNDIEIQQVVFQGDGLVVAYQDMDDIRVEGAVVIQRTVRIDSAHPDYGEDIDKLHRKVVGILRNALEDWAESEVFDVRAAAEDDDETGDRGMGE